MDRINMKVKAAILIIILIVVAAGGLFLYKSFEYNNVKNIREHIGNESYDEAIGLYNVASEKRSAIKNKLSEDIELVKAYLEVSKMSIGEEKLTTIKGLLDKYKDKLTEEHFSAVNKDLTESAESLQNSLKTIEDKKNAFNEQLDKDVNKAEEILKYLQEDFKEFNFDDLDKKLTDKKEKLKEEAAKAEAEKKAEEEKKVADSATEENNKAQIEISKTKAAQSSSQLITVVSSGGSYGELAKWEKDSNGHWNQVGKINARIGINGMKDASLVYEMDKCTPTGSYSLTEAFGAKANPGSSIPYRQLDGSEYWVDDIDSKYYNTMQFGEPNGRWKSAEHLSSFDKAYSYSVVIDYNRSPVVPGKSSAIFLHCEENTGTYGCVAVAENEMIKIINWLNPSKNPRILLDFSYDDIYSNY